MYWKRGGEGYGGKGVCGLSNVRADGEERLGRESFTSATESQDFLLRGIQREKKI